MRKGTLPVAAGAFLSLILSVALHAAARGGMPEPLTESGRLIEDMYYKIFLIATFVFLLVFGLMVFILVRYREKSGHGRATFEHERENLRLELVWILIPLAIVLWVGFVAYGGLLELDEVDAAPGEGMEVHITASQYNWEASYGEGVSVFSNPDGLGRITDANVFVFPADTPIRFNVTSLDVIHALYIQDQNGGPVLMIDANPTGPSKYNHVTRVFPEGEYFVQCKEMCLNPGHAYMRARIQAVPQDEFDAWFGERRLEAECKPLRVQKLGIEVAEDRVTLDGEASLSTTKDTCILATVTNTLDRSTTLSVSGLTASLTLEAGEEAFWTFDIEAAGDFTVGASTGGNATLEAIEATVVEVDLDEWAIIPPDIRLDAGETYLFTVRNVGTVAHNLFIGFHADDVRSSSLTINGGESTSFVWTPDEDTTFDTWCNVPGHYENGMSGTATVA